MTVNLKQKLSTEAYTEFRLLMNAMRMKGYRPADVARMLNKSRGAVSQYLAGYTKPSRTVLELLRRIAADAEDKSGKAKGVQRIRVNLVKLAEAQLERKELMELYEKLSVLRKVSPKSYQEVQRFIDVHYHAAKLGAHLDKQQEIIAPGVRMDALVKKVRKRGKKYTHAVVTFKDEESRTAS